jgi:hypothetical protein
MTGSAASPNPEYDNAGAGVPVLCPVCGSVARRVPRRLLDRVVNILWEFKRFRCANAMCGWEGNIRMRAKHFRRRP